MLLHLIKATERSTGMPRETTPIHRLLDNSRNPLERQNSGNLPKARLLAACTPGQHALRRGETRTTLAAFDKP
jgi:hypothetical protein